MRLRMVGVCVALLFAAALHARPVYAQSKSMKGQWIFTVTTPTTGPIPATVAFKANGRGTIDIGPESVPFTYREGTSADFYVSAEVPGEASITGMSFTMILRGRKTSDDAVNGAFFVIGDTSDPAAAGLLLAGSLTGVRQ